MTVSSAARKTPSIGLPSQAKTPTSEEHVVRHRARRPRHRRSSGTGPPGSRSWAASATPSAISALVRSSSPRLGPISSSRCLVTSPPAASARALRISASWSLVISPVRTEMFGLAALLHDGPREPGLRHRRPGVVDGDRCGRRVLDQPATGELDAEVEAAGGDAGHGEHEDDGGAGEPAPAMSHQVRVARRQPGAHPARRRDPGNGRPAADRPAGRPPTRRAPG